MILNALHLTNYKQYATLDLNFQEGLVGIIGKNGAGKSTIFEAILYCLYGKDGLNKELIRSSFAEPKAGVELQLEFSMGPVQYRIVRTLRGRKLDSVMAELYKNDVLLAKGTSAVNTEVVRLLKLDRDAFKRSVFSGQKELAQLSDTTGTNRTQMVRKMLGLDSLDKLQKNISTDGKALKNQLLGQEKFLLDKEALDAINKEIKALGKQEKTQTKELEAEKKKQDKLEKDRDKKQEQFEAESNKQQAFHAAQKELETLKERIAGLESQLKESEEKQKVLFTQQTNLEAQRDFIKTHASRLTQLQSQEKARQDYVNQHGYQDQLKELEGPMRDCLKRIRDLEEQTTQTNSLKEQLSQLEIELAAKQAVREQKRSEHQQIEKALGALDGRIRDRETQRNKLQEIGKDGTCPTCFQPVLDAYESVVNGLNAELETLQKNERAQLQNKQGEILEAGLQLRSACEELEQQISKHKVLLAKLGEQAQQLKNERSQFEQMEARRHRIQVILDKIGAVQFEPGIYDQLKKVVEADAPKYMQLLKEEDYLKREIPEQVQKIEALKRATGDAEKGKLEAEKKLKSTRFDEAAFNQVKEAFLNADQAIRAQRTQTQEMHTALLQTQHKLEQQNDQIQRHQRVLDELAETQSELDLLEKLLEQVKQFKSEILDRVSPGISQEASQLFSRITKGKYENIRVDENFDFSIADGGVYYPIDRFSGGEIDLANFCLRIAITKAIMDLNGNEQALEFLAFDEIFGSQDEERRHEIMLALNYLQEQFKQIYIVSHIETQKDFFPHILEVKHVDEGSSVRWI
ncbi:MAG: SMC family ATPase [Saprospiraceae bacterium]